MTFQAVYTPFRSTIASDSRENDRPLALAEGAFTGEALLTAAPGTDGPAPAEEIPVGSWEISLNEPADTLRFLAPEETAGLKLYLRSGDGWEQAEYTLDGSYLVIPLHGEVTGLAMTRTPGDGTLWYLLGICVLAGAAAGIFLLSRKKKK